MQTRIKKPTTGPSKAKPRRAVADSFKSVARALECDESEEAFDKALGKIGRAKPEPQKKRSCRCQKVLGVYCHGHFSVLWVGRPIPVPKNPEKPVVNPLSDSNGCGQGHDQA